MKRIFVCTFALILSAMFVMSQSLKMTKIEEK